MEKKYEISKGNYNLLMAVLHYNKYLSIESNITCWSVFVSFGDLMSVNKAMHKALSNHDVFEIYYAIETRNGLKSDKRFAGRVATMKMVFDGINNMLSEGEIVIVD